MTTWPGWLPSWANAGEAKHSNTIRMRPNLNIVFDIKTLLPDFLVFLSVSGFASVPRLKDMGRATNELNTETPFHDKKCLSNVFTLAIND